MPDIFNKRMAYWSILDRSLNELRDDDGTMPELELIGTQSHEGKSKYVIKYRCINLLGFF